MAAMASATPETAADGDYVPKNILMTGGAGFIGSHAVLLFVKKYPQYKARQRRATRSLPPTVAAHARQLLGSPCPALLPAVRADCEF